MRGKRNLASRLSSRIELQQPVNVADGIGGVTITWNKVADLWAEIAPSKSVRHREELIGDQLTEVNSYRITIRYRVNISHKMRLVLAGRRFNIRAITNPDEGKETLIIFADTGVAS